MANGKKTDQTRLGTAERHVSAFELRKQGFSYRDIGATLGVAGKTAFEDVRKGLAELAATRLESAAEYVTMELEHLDMAQQALHQHLESGDPQIINAWIKVSESRRKLLGLDAPQKIAQTNPDGTPAQYAELRMVVLNLLAPYPELRLALAAQLAEDAIDSE